MMIVYSDFGSWGVPHRNTNSKYIQNTLLSIYKPEQM